MYIGSFKSLLAGDVRAAEVVLYDHAGNPLSGFDQSRPANATLTSPTATSTSAVIAADNPARRKLVIVNEGTREVFVAFAGTASPTAYTVSIARNSRYETDLNGYTGDVAAVTASGTATLRVTEVTS